MLDTVLFSYPLCLRGDWLVYHAYDFIDGFSALFGDGNAVFPKRSLPLGSVTVDVLNLDDALLSKLHASALTLHNEVAAFLSDDYDAAQEAFANSALQDFFSLLIQFPVYRELDMNHIPSFELLRSYPDARERMRTKGTEEYMQTRTWLMHLHALVPMIRAFRQRGEKLLDENFSDVTERTPSGYAKRLSEYFKHVGFEYRFASDALEQEDLNEEAFERMRKDYRKELEREYFSSHIPISVTYRSLPHPKNDGDFLLAEEVFFRDVGTFLSLDLMRGLMAGHLPRRCAHCGRWFLLESGYDIRYCENPAPGEPDKTCRQVGAHRREARLNSTDRIRKEYRRVANRLKGQKFRRTLSVDDWNEYMRQAQDLRDDAMEGKLTVDELAERFDAISARRMKTK